MKDRWPIKVDRIKFEKIFEPLFKAIDPSFTNYVNTFDNDTFQTWAYNWENANCNCGFHDREDDFLDTLEHDKECNKNTWYCGCDYMNQYYAWLSENDHSDDCELCLPCFRYKVNGYELSWSRYTLVAATSNFKMKIDDVRKMVKHCIESLENKK